IPQIKDQSAGIGYEGHGCLNRAGTHLRWHESVELHVADVARQNLDLLEGTVAALQLLAHPSELLSRRWSLRWGPEGAECDLQVQIMTHGTQIRGEAVGELKAITRVAIGACLQMPAQRDDHLRGDRRVYVELCQIRRYAIDDAMAQCGIHRDDHGWDSRRQRPQPEGLDSGRCAVLYQEITDGVGR